MPRDYFDVLRSLWRKLIESRAVILFVVIAALFGCLIYRCFNLQIVNSEQYRDNYVLKLKKERTIEATRGNIYDRYGNLLAYNQLAYALVIEDNGSYDKILKPKNETLNAELAQIIKAIEKNGDKIDNNFPIFINNKGEYEFSVSGSSLQRFRADIYGQTYTKDLGYSEKLGYDTSVATPDQIMAYLMGNVRYGVSEEYSKKLAYEITVIRYNLSLNSYQKYITTTICSDLSEESMAYIAEHLSDLQGVSVEETSLRKYVDSKYFAQIIGYTGAMSEKEYEEIYSLDDRYSVTDVVGKSGIEQYMDSYLQGTKGLETVYVDNVGNVLEVLSHQDSSAGNDVYLSIDMHLQEAVYDLLEQQLAGILYSKILNIREDKDENDIYIPIYDVYVALIKNMLINVDDFSKGDASETEKAVYAAYLQKQNQVIAELNRQLGTTEGSTYKDLSPEYQAYSTYIVKYLKNQGIFDSSLIDTNCEMQQSWTNEELSVKEYLIYCIEQNWIDITNFSNGQKYLDSEEIYNLLVEDVLEHMRKNSGFDNLLYERLIRDDEVTGQQLCFILYDQGVIENHDDELEGLKEGKVSPYNFLKEKIRNIEISPGELGLDPCTASCVITDVKTGDLLCLVSYPGYDNNRMANSVDASYYYYLNNTASIPLYNYATQQRTAPGSTFKMVSATAGLSEGVITLYEEIEDEGIYTKVTPNIKCWYYPKNHSFETLSDAIRDSCNFYFNEVGYRLSLDNGVYNPEAGIEKLQKYAAMYGLDRTTGIEIEEYSPQIATEYPVTASMGQSNSSFTTVQLARYTTAIATEGNVFKYTLLDHVSTKDGSIIATYDSEIEDHIDVLDLASWNTIQLGMKQVVENSASFKDFEVSVAGKTGTAQENKNRPNHSLFIGYAPYSNPQISIATRIAYGYGSTNAAKVSRDILSYYFNIQDADELLDGQATDDVGGTATGFID